MKTILSFLAIIILFSSCGDNKTKKILVMSKGEATIDKATKTITVTSGTSHEEQTVEFPADGSLTLQVTTTNGKNAIDIPEAGYYVLNAKTDTIIGTKENYGAPAQEGKTFTQDFIRHSVDSLQQLLAGNAAAGNTYYILPGKAVKITDNPDATLVGPFNSLTSLEQTGDKVPEVYKFFTSKDVRENMARLQKMTVAPPSPNQ